MEVRFLEGNRLLSRTGWCIDEHPGTYAVRHRGWGDPYTRYNFIGVRLIREGASNHSDSLLRSNSS